jgi:hypothetical protein
MQRHDSHEAIEPVSLSNGVTLAAEIPANERAIAVRLLRDQRPAGEATIPYPSHGVAGGRFIVSPSERLAVLSLFSGQSEEGYDLFQLGETVSRIDGIPYQFGEGASFCFSADESILAMALPSLCSEWWIPWEEGESEPDGAGRLAFPFGQIHIHEIATGRMSVHQMRVSVPEDWQPSRAEYDPDLHPRFTPNGFALAMPWGVVQLPFPLPPVVTFTVNDSGSRERS